MRSGRERQASCVSREVQQFFPASNLAFARSSQLTLFFFFSRTKFRVEPIEICQIGPELAEPRGRGEGEKEAKRKTRMSKLTAAAELRVGQKNPIIQHHPRRHSSFLSHPYETSYPLAQLFRSSTITQIPQRTAAPNTRSALRNRSRQRPLQPPVLRLSTRNLDQHGSSSHPVAAARSRPQHA